MLDYQKYPKFNAIENIQLTASSHLKNINWRNINEQLIQRVKDPEGTYDWWYSRISKDNKIFHNSNSGSLVEDIEYANGSGHLNIEICQNGISELEIFNSLINDLPGLTYAGIFFMGPNSNVVDHTDKEQYNLLINVQVPCNAFLTIDDEQFFFKENDIFMFDGDLNHSATNTSTEDWILFVLRINKTEF